MNYELQNLGMQIDGIADMAKNATGSPPVAEHSHPEPVRPPLANGPEQSEGAQDKLREGSRRFAQGKLREASLYFARKMQRPFAQGDGLRIHESSGPLRNSWR